jgi:dipeptidyl aminopeptidase/acylaminoacyl peptidase
MVHEAGAQVRPYGSWPTPITSEVVVDRAVKLAAVTVDGDELVWSEGRPAEGGRTALVRRTADGRLEELLAADQNARTTVHEYGGGGWWVRDGIVWFAQWSDQRLYRRDRDGRSRPLTPEPEIPRGDRYADGELSPGGESIVCVREHHPAGGRGAIDVANEIVRLDAHHPSTPEVLVSGPDFVSTPRFSPDASYLSWLEWDLPNMPWDGNRLIVRRLADGEDQQVAGGERESVTEPQWQADGSLTFISDRSGWWNLYHWDPRQGQVEALVELEAEIGVPQWVFGFSRYAKLGDGRFVFARMRDGLDGLAVRLVDGTVSDLDLPFSYVADLAPAGEASFVMVGASPVEEMSLSRVTLGAGAEIEQLETLRPARDLATLGVPAECVSAPEAIDFPSAHGRMAHGLLYRPVNPSVRGPEGALPPLLVSVHGGPTSAARPFLNLEIQYLTSRGFTVLDVNYGGSSGYGRPYRELLNGNWGVVDVEDSIAAAEYLTGRGEVDPSRLCINGGSAGGFTTLASLAHAQTPFGAGADYFGVADLEALAIDTHKFESRYLDRIVGPYPQERELYRERSPIQHVEDFSRPLIVLQGLEDAVVPPNQATMIVDALRTKGVPVAYVALEGEQHGFRQAPNIRRALDSELSFYAQIFGFALPSEEGIEPVAIERPEGSVNRQRRPVSGR